MDDKLWRCSRFFTHNLLVDRKCTYDLRRFQTGRDEFDKLHAACKSLAVFVEHIRIHGTMNNSLAKGGRKGVAAGGAEGAASVPAKFLVYFAPSACWGGAESGGGGGGGRGGGGAGSSATNRRGGAAKSAAGTSASGSNGGGDASFGKQQAEAVIAYMAANDISWLFLVTGSSVTAPAQKLLERAVHVEYWPVAACLSCAETHQTVPACRRLTAREKKEFYAQNGISAANLPRMLVTDRMSKYWGFVPGDVVELHRKTHVGIVKGEMRVVTHA